MSDDLETSRRAFLFELEASISSHDCRRRFDAFLHQVLVIGSAIAGFLSLAFGLFAKEKPEFAVYAGIVGALTSVFAILLQQLHCVRAVNWHERMSIELGAIRGRYLYEFQGKPEAKQLGTLNGELAALRRSMADVWEKVTTTGPTALGRVQRRRQGE